MSDRDLLKMMLQDAISWQASLADAVRGTEDYADAAALLKRYRAYAKKRFGDLRSPIERALEGAEVVNVTELLARPRTKP